MYAGSNFSSMDSNETELLTFDYSSILGTNETILSATWTVALVGGAALPVCLSGSPVNTTTTTSQLVTGLTAGNNYVVSAAVATSFGQVLSLWANLPCLAIP